MPRQIRTPYPDLNVSGIIDISQGGTGKDNVLEAVEALGGIHRSKIGTVNGVAAANSSGLLNISGSHAAVNEMLDGPRQIAKGETAEYTISNYDSRLPINIAVSAGQRTIVGDKVFITAPTSGSSITLTMGSRSVVIPLLDPGVAKPVVISPETGSSISSAYVTFLTAAFQSTPEVFGNWTEVTEGGIIHLDAESTAVEFEAGNGGEGEVKATIGGKEIIFPVSVVRRNVVKGAASSFTLEISGSGKFRYREMTASAIHLRTEWQIATDEGFTEIIHSYTGTGEELRSLTHLLEPGQYYMRARYVGETGN